MLFMFFNNMFIDANKYYMEVSMDNNVDDNIDIDGHVNIDKYVPEIVDFHVDWRLIKEACMATVGKKAGKEPTSEWKKKLMIAGHSPIRRSLISWKWDEIPSYVSTHFCRHHVSVEKYCKTSRTDRTGVPREERRQTDMISMEMDANIQSLINIAERRLCTQADSETRKYMEGLVDAISERDEDIAFMMVPNCVKLGGCPEAFGSCKFFNNFAKNLTKEELIDINARYNAYNNYRKKIRSLKK